MAVKPSWMTYQRSAGDNARASWQEIPADDILTDRYWQLFMEDIITTYLENRTLPATLTTQHANLRKVYLRSARADGGEDIL